MLWREVKGKKRRGGRFEMGEKKRGRERGEKEGREGFCGG